MNEFDELKKTLHEIEPPAGAKERMLANIRAKAQATMEMVEKEPDNKGISEMNQEAVAETILNEKKTRRWNIKLLRVLLPMAACFVIAIIVIEKTKSIDPIVNNEQENDGVLFASPYQDVASPGELERLLQIPFLLPEEATEVSCSSLDNRIGYVTFICGEYFYKIAGSKESGYFDGEYGELLEEEMIDREFNAILSVYDSDGLVINCISWSSGENHYFLTTMDGCEKETIKNLYFAIR